METNSVTKKGRMEEQDVGKGLAMFMVLFLHSVTLFTEGGRDLQVKGATLVLGALFGYIMGFFVIMAGYNYKKSGESWGKTVLKRLKQLLIPFVIIATVIWVLLGAYLIIRGETDIRQIVNSYFAFWITDPVAGWLGLDASRTFVGQALGPAWFIKSLFTASLIFLAVADFALEKASRLFSIVTGLLMVTFVLRIWEIELPWLMEIAPAMCAIMLLGAYMKKLDIYTGHESRTLYKWLNPLAAFAFVFSLGMVVPRVGMISSGRMDMVAGPMEVYITAIYCVLGTYVMLAICRPLSKVPVVSTFLKWFGKNCLFVLLIHGAVLRIFTDLFGITGGDTKVRVRNILAFLCTLVVVCLILLVMDKVRGVIKAKKEPKA